MAASIKFTIGADSRPFKKAMDDVQAIGRKGSEAVENALRGVRGSVLSTGAALAGATAAVSAFTAGIMKVARYGGEISDLAARTGLTAEETILLSRAFKNAGLSGEAVGGAMNRLQKALAGVNEDGEPTNKTFAQLGLNIAALRSQSPASAFEAVGTAIASIEDPTRRAAAAMSIFGKSGGELLALFRDSSAFETARTQIGALAASIGTNVETLDRFSDAVDAAFEVKQLQFFAGAATALAGDLDSAADAINKLDFTEAGRGLGEVLVGVRELARELDEIQKRQNKGGEMGSGLPAPLRALQFLNPGRLAYEGVKSLQARGQAAIAEDSNPTTKLFKDAAVASVKGVPAVPAPVNPQGPDLGLAAAGVLGAGSYVAGAQAAVTDPRREALQFTAPVQAATGTTRGVSVPPSKIAAFNELKQTDSRFQRLQQTTFGSGTALPSLGGLRSASLIGSGAGNLDATGFRAGSYSGSFRLPTRAEKAAAAKEQQRKDESLVGTNELLKNISTVLDDWR